MATRIAVNNFKSFGGIPMYRTAAITIRYTIEPSTTAMRLRTKDFVPNTTSPIITEAKPITMVPIPMPTSAKPWN